MLPCLGRLGIWIPFCLYLAQGVVVSRGVIYELNSSSGISEAVSRGWRHHISKTLGLEKENNKEKGARKAKSESQKPTERL